MARAEPPAAAAPAPGAVRIAARAGGLLALCAALALVAGACGRISVTRLYALHLQQAPGRGTWESSLPLVLRSGGGNLNGPNRRLADLALDTDPVHLGSASCHHGPPITSPVMLETRAFYTDDALHVEVRWEDATPDTASRSWRKGPAGWRLDQADEDGIAILWSHAAGPFGCQEACHMSDFALRRGELIDLRSMFMAKEGEWEEAWIWKPSVGGQALTLDNRGFVTAAGETYRAVNSAVAVDPSLQPEARRAGTFGPEDRPLRDGRGDLLPADAVEAPSYLFGRPGDGGGLSATAERAGEKWRVVFTRALAAGERRQGFRPGGSYSFGVAVFDATSTNHHIVRNTQTLELIAPAAPPTAADGEATGAI